MRLRSEPESAGRVAAQLALLPIAAFVVHQLRYLFAFGGHAGAVLEQTGHAYLNSVVPWLVALVAVVVGGFLRSLGRALAGQTTVARYAASLGGLWLACAVALVAIFVAQELLEGVFLTGHPAGWIGVFGYGGWWAIPSAAIVGLVLASLFHGAFWVLDRATARRAARRPAARRPPPLRRAVADASLMPAPPLAAGWSDRGPPQPA